MLTNNVNEDDIKNIKFKLYHYLYVKQSLYPQFNVAFEHFDIINITFDDVTNEIYIYGVFLKINNNDSKIHLSYN